MVGKTKLAFSEPHVMWPPDSFRNKKLRGSVCVCMCKEQGKSAVCAQFLRSLVPSLAALNSKKSISDLDFEVKY